MAEGLHDGVSWGNDEEWRRAGPRIHTLAGLFVCQPGIDDPMSPEGATLLASYEAEQHLLHLGRVESPACWTICGLVSGYLSRTSGKEIFVFEDRCVAAGDDACHIVGRTREAWGAGHAGELAYYDARRLQDCLDVSLERVTRTLEAAEATLRAHRRRLVLVEPEFAEPDSIVARSKPMKRVLDLARRVARVDASVLVMGESGVGKERIARLLHDSSPRAAGPFIAVNCGAITEALLESELFGHRRGAFTGASEDKRGLFEVANGGTLFLDEVTETPLTLQAKLLRVLQEGEVRPLGTTQPRYVDVRVVAATNRDLEREVAEGRFREDLYYRLNVFPLRVPALSERREDIPLLASRFLSRYSKEIGKPIAGFTQEATETLRSHDWPGNVRELENEVQRLVIQADADAFITPELLSPRVRRLERLLERAAVAPGSLKEMLDQVERHLIAEVLRRHGGNKTSAARELGITREGLHKKLRQLGPG
jgi:transcriptional regulator with PAS, ATPase and Fis domain